MNLTEQLHGLARRTFKADRLIGGSAYRAEGSNRTSLLFVFRAKRVSPGTVARFEAFSISQVGCSDSRAATLVLGLADQYVDDARAVCLALGEPLGFVELQRLPK